VSSVPLSVEGDRKHCLTEDIEIGSGTAMVSVSLSRRPEKRDNFKEAYLRQREIRCSHPLRLHLVGRDHFLAARHQR
jgi:hypothetical protein